MKMENVLVIGGTGFVGRHVVRRLAERGINVTVPSRRRERAKHLIVLPTVEVMEANVHDAATLAQLMAGQDAVINLVGVLQGGNGKPYGKGFARAHVDLPRLVAATAEKSGVKRLVHMSALKAAADAPSGYLRSKAEGEATMRTSATAAVTIFRPSVIFGAGDSFLTLFATLQKYFLLMPLGCPDAKFQPVWVEDVARCMVECLERDDSIGKAYDLCGPTVYSLRELVALAGQYGGRECPIVGLPDRLSFLQAWAMEFVPGGLMSRDNYYSMQVPNICDAGCSLPFGFSATPLEGVAPGYLADGRARANNDKFRVKARR